jgi:hypothetical protein
MGRPGRDLLHHPPESDRDLPIPNASPGVCVSSSNVISSTPGPLPGYAYGEFPAGPRWPILEPPAWSTCNSGNSLLAMPKLVPWVCVTVIITPGDRHTLVCEWMPVDSRRAA